MDAGRFSALESADALEALVLDIGMLPLVDCGVEGFSVKAFTPRERWFVADVEGPWEWRETVAERGKVVYGRLLGGKCGFVSPYWFSHLANWRRRGMDFDERYADGMVSRMEKQIMDLLRDRGPMLTRELRYVVGKKGFETAAASLQMRTDVLIRRMEYKRDAFGRPYGPGTSRLAASDQALGEDAVFAQFDLEPEASREAIRAHLAQLLPRAEAKGIDRIIK